IHGKDRSTTILDRAGTVVVQLLVVMRGNVAARKHRLDVRHKLRIHGHHVFEVAVSGAVLDHPDLAITLNDLSLDFAHLLIEKYGHIFLAAQNRFTRLNDTVRAQRISSARPTKRRLSLLPG